MGTDISMTNLVIHIDEALDAPRREALVDAVHGANGVIALGYHNEKPHLMIVVFNPEDLASADVLNLAQSQGIHAGFTGG